MAVHHDIGGVEVSSDTFRLEFGYVLGAGKKTEGFTIDYIDTVKLWILVILAFLEGKMTVSWIFRPEVEHNSDLDETNAEHLQFYISTRINRSFVGRCDLQFFPILEIAGLPAFWVTESDDLFHTT